MTVFPSAVFECTAQPSILDAAGATRVRGIVPHQRLAQNTKITLHATRTYHPAHSAEELSQISGLPIDTDPLPVESLAIQPHLRRVFLPLASALTIHGSPLSPRLRRSARASPRPLSERATRARGSPSGASRPTAIPRRKNRGGT